MHYLKRGTLRLSILTLGLIIGNIFFQVEAKNEIGTILQTTTSKEKRVLHHQTINYLSNSFLTLVNKRYITKEFEPLFDLNENKSNETLVFDKAKITVYNPVIWQNDSSPCINHTTAPKLNELFGHGGDLCKLNKAGIKTVAVPQDRLEYVYKYLGQKVPTDKIVFKVGDKIRIESDDERCVGEFYVADAFNSRFNGRQKIDIFKKELKGNFRCMGAKVYKVD